MKKIPTIYLRDPEDRAHVTDKINPECQWVFDGEGVATRKFDGTCVKLNKFGGWFARREVKPNQEMPISFVAEHYDPVTKKWQGWIPIEESPFRKFLEAALAVGHTYTPGTYELIGPKINGNPEGVEFHQLIPHGREEFSLGWEPLALIRTCRERGYEGVVWHHPDGQMAKLKVRDFK